MVANLGCSAKGLRDLDPAEELCGPDNPDESINKEFDELDKFGYPNDPDEPDGLDKPPEPAEFDERD